MSKKDLSRRLALKNIGLGGSILVINPLGFNYNRAVSHNLAVDKIRINGVMKIVINDEVFEPWAFRSFRPAPNTVSSFYKSGVRLMNQLHSGLKSTLNTPYSLYGEYWKGIKEYDFSVIDKQMEMFIENAPDAYFNIMLQLDTRQWYLDQHPESRNTFRKLVQTVGIEKWREDTLEHLKDTIGYLENKYGDKIFAYSLLCGLATEWFTSANFIEPEEEMTENFLLRKQIYKEYHSDRSINLPVAGEIMSRSNGILFHPMEDHNKIEFWKFQANLISDTILFFAEETKKMVKNRKLVGLFYGYSIWTGNLYKTGHLAYEKVWNSPYVDMIYQPSRYGMSRSFGGASGFQSTIDSVDLNNKLAFQEIDHATYISPKGAPKFNQQLKNKFESQMTLRREFVLSRVKRIGLWWFDMYNGNFESKEIMDDISNMRDINDNLSKFNLKSNSEIAVFVNSESVHFSPTMTTDFVRIPPETLSRIGAPYDVFSFNDLSNPNLNLDQYKLVIFLNSFKIDSKYRSIIKNKIQCNHKTILWFYAADYIGENENDINRMSETIGMNIEELKRDSDGIVKIIKNDDFFNFNEETKYGFSPLTEGDNRDLVDKGSLPTPLTKILPSPLFYINDKDAVILGNYIDNDKPAIGYKENLNFTSFWSAAPVMPVEIYRRIADYAGVHLYSKRESPLYVNNHLLGIHIQEDGSQLLQFKNKDTFWINEVFENKKFKVEKGCLKISGDKGKVKLFIFPKGKELSIK